MYRGVSGSKIYLHEFAGNLDNFPSNVSKLRTSGCIIAAGRNGSKYRCEMAFNLLLQLLINFPVNGSLELLANISTTNARFELFDGEMLNQICNFIRTGTVEQARHAAIIISNTDASDLRADIIEVNTEKKDEKYLLKMQMLTQKPVDCV